MVNQNESVGKWAVEYDRSDREYDVRGPEGEVVKTFPAKQGGEAFQFAVSLFEPALYAAVVSMVTKRPELERTAWKAAALVVAGAVEVFTPQINDCVAMVASSDGMGRYAILLHTDRETGREALSCNCDSFAMGSAPVVELGGVSARLCKHILALHLHRRVRGATVQR